MLCSRCWLVVFTHKIDYVFFRISTLGRWCRLPVLRPLLAYPISASVISGILPPQQYQNRQGSSLKPTTFFHLFLRRLRLVMVSCHLCEPPRSLYPIGDSVSSTGLQHMSRPTILHCLDAALGNPPSEF